MSVVKRIRLQTDLMVDEDAARSIVKLINEKTGLNMSWFEVDHMGRRTDDE
mgnify:CR=1 FL=1